MPSRNLPGLGLEGFWALGENNWKDGMDQNLLALSVLAQIGAKSRSLNAPPGTPANGDVYLVGQSPSGAWAGKGGMVAVYDQETWKFFDARNGMIVYVEDEQIFYRYHNGWALFLSMVQAPANPKFSAFLNYDFTFSAPSVWEKIPFNNTLHNDQGSFDAGSNQFTAPKDGTYLFTAAWNYKIATTAPTAWGTGFGINGAIPTDQHYVIFRPSANNNLTMVSCTSIINLSEGDAVAAYGRCQNNVGTAVANVNHFQGTMIP